MLQIEVSELYIYHIQEWESSCCVWRKIKFDLTLIVQLFFSFFISMKQMYFIWLPVWRWPQGVQAEYQFWKLEINGVFQKWGRNIDVSWFSQKKLSIKKEKIWGSSFVELILNQQKNSLEDSFWNEIQILVWFSSTKQRFSSASFWCNSITSNSNNKWKCKFGLKKGICFFLVLFPHHFMFHHFISHLVNFFMKEGKEII